MSQRVIKIKWSSFIKHTEIDDATIPDDPGVYEFYSKLKGKETKKRKYVGMAGNLNTVLISHLSEDEDNECLKKLVKDFVWFYRYAIIKNEDNRKDAELGLWKKHTYECNKIEPPGSGKGNFKIEES